MAGIAQRQGVDFVEALVQAAAQAGQQIEALPPKRQWHRPPRQLVAVHVCIYGLTDGLVKNLKVTSDSAEQLDATFLYDQ